jgi:membrane protein
MFCRKLLKKNSFVSYVAFAVCDLFESDYMFYAASIAYFTLMSIIPLFIFLFFLGMVIFHVNFQTVLPKELYSSPLKPIIDRLNQIVNNSGLISGTAAAVMLWFSRGVFLSIERAFCEILKKESSSSFIYRHIIVIFVIFLLWALLLVSYVAHYALTILLPQFPELSFLSSLPAPVLLFTILVLLYYFLLPVELPLNPILKVSLLVFFVLAVFERVFVWFVLNVSKVSVLYGSFAALIVFLIWIYYSATVILFGAGILKGKLISEGVLDEDSKKL